MKSNLFAAARLLAIVLAVTVVCFGLLAANGEFHRALHHGGAADSNGCVLCLFAHGQVDSPASATVPAACVAAVLDLTPPAESIVLVDFTYLLFPSRAPPAVPTRALKVVG
ncbi:MAG TPA: hypothetical protein VMU04_00390 [Candidatus Acidoferrum sp.]|nr:hypothetical protein [Candidatus Acidoferrum sp.]